MGVCDDEPLKDVELVTVVPLVVDLVGDVPRGETEHGTVTDGAEKNEYASDRFPQLEGITTFRKLITAQSNMRSNPYQQWRLEPVGKFFDFFPYRDEHQSPTCSTLKSSIPLLH